MTDLIERLRTPWTNPEATPTEFAEAADEIERLRSELKIEQMWVKKHYEELAGVRDLYQDARQQWEACEEALDACKADAERYRWFAEHCPYVIFSVNYETNNLDVMLRDDRMWSWGKEQLDAAIDAAMKREGE